jgi:hypothetical protein
MKKIFFMLILFALTSIIYVDAQVRRIVLLEEATNASCTPCAQNNPNLQAFISENFGGVISLRYHAWWPGTDPMYSLNPGDNSARINYYGITGVPNYLIDGTDYGVPSSPEGMASQMTDRLALKSPVKIIVSANITSTNVDAVIKLIGITPVTQTNLKLRSSVIERWIHYATPPGSNGEKDFQDVMRKLLPDANGFTVSSINPGDTLTYNVNTPVNSAWNWQDLAVVAWLQSDNTKEIIQSNINLPTYIIESDDQLAEFIELNSTYTKTCRITNDNLQTLNIRLKKKIASIPSGWGYNLIYNSNNVDSVDISILPGETKYFQMVINSGANPGSLKAKIFAQNLDDNYKYGFGINYFGVVRQGDILFVDDDGGANYQNYYFAAFDSLGYKYTYIDQAYVGQLKPVLISQNFPGIFWHCGWGFPAFVPADVDFLKTYLNAGGQLFIAGQDIGWDIFDASGSSNFPEAVDFYHNYLDANYVADNSGVYSMEGIAGTIFEGLSFNIGTIYSRYPEQIASFSGNGTLLLKYTGTTKYGAISHQGPNYKTIYLGIGLEQITSADARELLILKTINYFNILVPVELTSFSSSISSEGITLYWSTASELNNHGFEIEKSSDGISFYTIGFVKGYGTTTETRYYSFTDKIQSNAASTIYYRLKQVDFDGKHKYSEVLTVDYDLPKEFSLDQNYPNPFNPSTTIKYSVPKEAVVTIKLYDLTGQEVVVLLNEVKKAGTYQFGFDSGKLASGTYFYRMTSDGFSSVRKMTILK